jgi:hypothetical protein
VLEFRPTQVIEVPKVEPQVDQLPDYSKTFAHNTKHRFRDSDKESPGAGTGAKDMLSSA